MNQEVFEKIAKKLFVETYESFDEKIREIDKILNLEPDHFISIHMLTAINLAAHMIIKMSAMCKDLKEREDLKNELTNEFLKGFAVCIAGNEHLLKEV